MGHEVMVAPGSFYALTLIERNCPDVLVAWPDVGEPSAEELCAIVREDPALERIRLVLVRPEGLAPVNVPNVITVLPGAPATVVAAMRIAIHELSRNSPAPDSGDGGQVKGGLVGRLETIQLSNLVQALAQLLRSGCLRVMFLESESRIYFDSGRLIHATFGVHTGEQALRESLVEAEVQPGALFSFDRYDQPQIQEIPVTITSRLDIVLLEASVFLEGRATDGTRDEEG
jgi:hypothetical protein